MKKLSIPFARLLALVPLVFLLYLFIEVPFSELWGLRLTLIIAFLICTLFFKK